MNNPTRGKESFYMQESNTVFEAHAVPFWTKTINWYHAEMNFGNIPKLFQPESVPTTAKLGLQYLNDFSSNDGRTFYKFKVIDESKWLLTRIKYGF
jgi:hypothetical protein